jgi:large subunit ribosomal protein L4
LGDLVAAGKVLTVDSFSVADGKTKSFVAALDAIAPLGKILVVGNTFDDSTYLAARNVAYTQLVTGSGRQRRAAPPRQHCHPRG